MEYDEELSRKEYSFKPSPAVESNWRTKRYVPEVQFYGEQYIVGEACSTHEEAMGKAKAFAEHMKQGMLALGTGMVKTLKKAKA